MYDQRLVLTLTIITIGLAFAADNSLGRYQEWGFSVFRVYSSDCRVIYFLFELKSDLVMFTCLELNEFVFVEVVNGTVFAVSGVKVVVDWCEGKFALELIRDLYLTQED